MSVRVQQNDFDLATEYNAVTKGNTSAGAVVTFTGRVRDLNPATDKTDNKIDDKTDKVSAITLEHYPAMTQKQLEKLEADARDRWPLEECVIIHRFGRLEPGDQIVLVITAATHRQDAFDAAQFLMDWLKTKAPFWKKEQTPSGERWVDARSSDDKAAKRWES